MPRVALIHDFLLDLRGAERVFAAICDAYPEADVFTAVYDPVGTEGRFAARDPQASFLQKLRPTARTFRPLLPMYPHAIESLDLRGYDLVISSSSAWAHGVLVDPGATHVCYCHNPFRYAWSEREATLAARNFLTRPPLRALLSRWRQWDWIAAQRVDAYIANSAVTAARIRRYFGRESTILHPPVELSRFSPGPVGAALPRAGGADGAQAHRRRDPRLQRARAAAGRGGGRAGVAVAAPARGADRAADRPALRRRGRGPAALRARAGGDRRGGVRDRRGRVARVGAARDRAARGRRARDGDRRPHRLVLRRRRTIRRRSRPPCAPSTWTPSTRSIASRRRDASESNPSRSSCAPSSRRRAGSRPALQSVRWAVYYPADRHEEAPNP